MPVTAAADGLAAAIHTTLAIRISALETACAALAKEIHSLRNEQARAYDTALEILAAHEKEIH